MNQYQSYVGADQPGVELLGNRDGADHPLPRVGGTDVDVLAGNREGLIKRRSLIVDREVLGPLVGGERFGTLGGLTLVGRAGQARHVVPDAFERPPDGRLGGNFDLLRVEPESLLGAGGDRDDGRVGRRWRGGR